MNEPTGKRPAGFVYVAWHPTNPNHTKIGYTFWHPRNPCARYPSGKKRLHDVEKYLQAFGFGCLSDWCSDYHPHAQIFEQQVRYELRSLKRRDVGRNQEIYDITPEKMIALIQAKFDAQTH